MLEEEYTVESVSLAKEILSGLEASINDSSKNLGIKAESWFVVRNTKMPSVLIETGFLSNETEALSLNDTSY
jgi:N-acetylmuramoyl-L-alanine amidase